MKKLLYLLSLYLFFTSTSISQQNFALYNMRFIPQSMYANPSLMPASRINIGLPVLSSLYTNFGNSGFKLDDLFKTSGGTVSYNVDGLIKNLQPNNYLMGSLQIDLFSFGIKWKNNYISFNVTEKGDFWFRYPKDFLDFIWKGNGAFLGEEKKFNFGINATHYREWGLGLTRELNEKLTVGGRIKLLSGLENISTEKSDMTFTTNSTDFSYRASSDILINSSVDTGMSTNFSASKYIFNFKNMGLGIDLGANYKYNEKLSFSVSLIDIGYINWKTHTTNYQSKNPGASFVYKGVGLNAFGTDTLELGDSFVKLSDSLTKTFDISSDNHNSYKTYLPAQFYIGANYKINKKIGAGVLLYAQMLDKSLRPGATISMSTEIGKILSSVVTYSIYNRSYNNMGLGLSLNLGPVQIYAVSDNVLGMLLFNSYKSTDGSSFKLPAYTKTANVRVGLNLTFGRKDDDKDKDGVKDKEDLCPEMAGLKELKGCPDKDGDKVVDKDDACPDVAGLAQFGGCPDTDGDRIKDTEDACPNDKGPIYTQGCPDTDNDSIKDAEDECPNEFGLQSLKGCPDKDKDGVRDKDDKCMDKVGSIDNDGCPLVKLILLDSNGNVTATIIRNKNGEFTYEKLPVDASTAFRLEGDDSNLKEINLLWAGQNVKLVKDQDGNFRFIKLDSDALKLAKENEDNAALKFKEREKVAATEKAAIEKPAKQDKQLIALKAKTELKPEVKIKSDETKILKAAITQLDFQNGKEVIKQSSFESLSELASLLKKNPTWKLHVVGHTDDIGDQKENLTLSKNRAEMVKKFMVLSGIPHDRVITEYFGSSKPIADNKTEVGRKKNRRVEMDLVKFSTKSSN